MKERGVIMVSEERGTFRAVYAQQEWETLEQLEHRAATELGTKMQGRTLKVQRISVPWGHVPRWHMSGAAPVQYWSTDDNKP